MFVVVAPGTYELTFWRNLSSTSYTLKMKGICFCSSKTQVIANKTTGRHKEIFTASKALVVINYYFYRLKNCAWEKLNTASYKSWLHVLVECYEGLQKSNGFISHCRFKEILVLKLIFIFEYVTYRLIIVSLYHITLTQIYILTRSDMSAVEYFMDVIMDLVVHSFLNTVLKYPSSHCRYTFKSCQNPTHCFRD